MTRTIDVVSSSAIVQGGLDHPSRYIYLFWPNNGRKLRRTRATSQQPSARRAANA
jgi:hypothetical protein